MEFLTENTSAVLIIIKIFLVVYFILATVGVVFRIIKHIKENGKKKSIGFIIYNVLGEVIFLVAVVMLFKLSG